MWVDTNNRVEYTEMLSQNTTNNTTVRCSADVVEAVNEENK